MLKVGALVAKALVPVELLSALRAATVLAAWNGRFRFIWVVITRERLRAIVSSMAIAGMLGSVSIGTSAPPAAVEPDSPSDAFWMRKRSWSALLRSEAQNPLTYSGVADAIGVTER